MDSINFDKVYNKSRNGAEGFYKHPFGPLRYTDGVKELTETGIYWMLDIAATELKPAFSKVEPGDLGIFNIEAEDNKAMLSLSFGDKKLPAWTRKINFTDLHNGSWNFYIVNEGTKTALDLAMILPSEY